MIKQRRNSSVQQSSNLMRGNLCPCGGACFLRLHLSLHLQHHLLHSAKLKATKQIDQINKELKSMTKFKFFPRCFRSRGIMPLSGEMYVVSTIWVITNCICGLRSRVYEIFTFCLNLFLYTILRVQMNMKKNRDSFFSKIFYLYTLGGYERFFGGRMTNIYCITQNLLHLERQFLHQSIQKHRFPICVQNIMWL